jgi:hypothetical protein
MAVVDPIAAMERQKNQSEKSSSGNSFLFFALRDKSRALIRPLCTLKQSDVVSFHHFWDQVQGSYVDAICAGEQCYYCQQASIAENERTKKSMAAKEVFMLPVWVHAIQSQRMDADTKTPILDENNNPIWDRLTYIDKNTNEEKPVSGLRIMTLSFRSAYRETLELFYSMFKNQDDITARDFIIERQGGDQTTKYVPSKKNPSPFKVNIGDAPRTQEAIHQRILQAAPMLTSNGSALASNSSDDGDGDGTPVF